MVMSCVWVGLLAVSLFSSILTGQGSALSAAVLEGAQAGITLSVSLAGSLCLWSGVGRLMEAAGVTGLLSNALSPLLRRLFPSSWTDAVLSRALSGNVCANLLGLGNAATPMGIQAAKRLAHGEAAGDELCRLIVLNTASIQLLPANLAAVRSSLGCETPFDILPAVWVTSLCAAGLGLACGKFLERFFRQ